MIPDVCERRAYQSHIASIVQTNVITHRVNASEGEGGREHAHVLPVELFRLLALDENLRKAVWDVLSRVHACLYRHDYRAIHLNEVVVQLGRARVRLVGKPLQRFDEIDEVRHRPCDRIRTGTVTHTRQNILTSEIVELHGHSQDALNKRVVCRVRPHREGDGEHVASYDVSALLIS